MVKHSTGIARTVWVANSECCQKQYCLKIGFSTWLKLLALAAKSRDKLGFCSLTHNFPPLAGNHLCNGILRELYAYNSNFKRKPAPSKSQQAAGQASETGQNLSERCIYALLLLREKRVVLSPMLERKAVCGKQQPTEGCRLRLVSKKAVVTDFAGVGTFWFFSVMKRTYRTT